jgi:hypothetical protein
LRMLVNLALPGLIRRLRAVATRRKSQQQPGQSQKDLQVAAHGPDRG